MGAQISINYPEKLAFLLKMENVEFAKEIKTISLVKISSGLASNILELSRIDFLELVEKYNVSYFNKGLENELLDDLDNA
ncbi:MAG: UPF0175 family protein [Bacteroidales bacterium]|nr:UPF0175 family protein [Bacteroidales bacterium]